MAFLAFRIGSFDGFAPCPPCSCRDESCHRHVVTGQTVCLVGRAEFSRGIRAHVTLRAALLAWERPTREPAEPGFRSEPGAEHWDIHSA